MITGLLLEDDLLDVQYYHRHQGMRRVYIVLALMAVGGLVLWVASELSFFALVLTCGAVGGFAGELIVRWLILPRRVKRIFAQTEGYKLPFTYSWDQDALSVEAQTGRARRPWSHYRKWRESDKSFLLYHSDDMFEVIPKRWFKSSRQMGEFKAMLYRIGN